jgi:hypothetical protein
VRLRLNKALLAATALMVLATQFGYNHQHAQALTPTQLGDHSLKLSDNRAGKAAQYALALQKLGTGNIGSLKLEFCSSSAIPGAPCTAPPGLDASAASLVDQTGITDFSLLPSTSNNVVVLSRVPAAVAQIPVSYTLTNVMNPSTSNTYFLRIYVYPSNDGTGSSSASAGLAFSLTNPVSVNATVPPYLTFCTGTTIPIFDCSSATGSYIDFGELSSSRVSSGTAQMMTTTNAGGGYSIRVVGTSMTSGNNVINALDTPDTSRIGTSQFGLNLRNNSAPFVGAEPDGLGVGVAVAGYNNPDHYKFTSGDIVASAFQPDLYKRYTISYIVNVPKAQPPGIYVTTLTYICLANF